jgi:hypothetical protein
LRRRRVAKDLSHQHDPNIRSAVGQRQQQARRFEMGVWVTEDAFRQDRQLLSAQLDVKGGEIGEVVALEVFVGIFSGVIAPVLAHDFGADQPDFQPVVLADLNEAKMWEQEGRYLGRIDISPIRNFLVGSLALPVIEQRDKDRFLAQTAKCVVLHRRSPTGARGAASLSRTG